MDRTRSSSSSYLMNMVRNLRPSAQAVVRGSADYPSLNGLVTFYEQGGGTLVAAEFRGLPGTDGCGADQEIGVGGNRFSDRLRIVYGREACYNAG